MRWIADVTAAMTPVRLVSDVVRGSRPYQTRSDGSRALWTAAMAAACSGVAVRTSPSKMKIVASSQILRPLPSANRPNR